MKAAAGGKETMELNCRTLEADSPYCEEARELYELSFPPNERRPFPELFSCFRGAGELLAFFEGECFTGFVYLLSLGDITHILYFAVPAELRGCGYGSRILGLLRKRYPGQRIIADLELPEKNAPDETGREKRAAFYRKNGYRETDIRYRWEGENYFIMSNGGDVTRAEFGGFWGYFYSDNA